VEQFGITGYPINALQWPHRVCVGPAWLERVNKKPSVKADLIYINCATVFGQCLSVVIVISNKMDFISCVNWDESTISYTMIKIALLEGDLKLR